MHMYLIRYEVARDHLHCPPLTWYYNCILPIRPSFRELRLTKIPAKWDKLSIPLWSLRYRDYTVVYQPMFQLTRYCETRKSTLYVDAHFSIVMLFGDTAESSPHITQRRSVDLENSKMLTHQPSHVCGN